MRRRRGARVAGLACVIAATLAAVAVCRLAPPAHAEVDAPAPAVATAASAADSSAASDAVAGAGVAGDADDELAGVVDAVDDYVAADPYGASVKLYLVRDGALSLAYTRQQTAARHPDDAALIGAAASGAGDDDRHGSASIASAAADARASSDDVASAEASREPAASSADGERAPMAVADGPDATDAADAAAGSSDAGDAATGAVASISTGESVEYEDETYDWGKCSDLLVWLSVMRLVESGQIDLSTPVRSELPAGVTLPSGYASVTMLDLMNHTTGLNVSAIGTLPATYAGTSATESLARYQVSAAYQTGSVVSYSSYDVALAAAIVEGVTGEDICAYIVDNILTPLGMDDTAVAVGVSTARMRQSSDERTARVASSLASEPSSDSLITRLAGVLAGTAVEDLSFTAGSMDGAAVTCVGSVSDMIKLVSALVGSSQMEGVFSSDAVLDQFFETTRTYPGLGTRRVAHGLFALSLRPDAVGITDATSGTTCAVYLDRETGSAAIVIVGESGRAGFAQGIAGRALGPSATPEALMASEDARRATSPAPSAQAQAGETDWDGVYQDVGLPSHGPLRVLTAIDRVVVRITKDGTIGGEQATSLGHGAYVTEEPAGNDPYRFHVSLANGKEFSRATADYVKVPTSRLAFEWALTIGAGLAAAASLGYAVVGVVGLVRARARRRRWRGQASCLLLAVATLLALGWTAGVIIGGKATILALIPAVEVLNAAYVALCVLVALWVVVTRLRGTCATRRQVTLALAMLASALAVCLNLVYWEILP
ncbi:beta-lactamase family protein [bacterium]|nr:beta-lactamase family protein [bacterium]